VTVVAGRLLEQMGQNPAEAPMLSLPIRADRQIGEVGFRHGLPAAVTGGADHACPDVLIGQVSSSGCRHRALRTRSATSLRSERAARR
jgi:hypothetical protein